MVSVAANNDTLVHVALQLLLESLSDLRSLNFANSILLMVPTFT